ncbi:MAG: acyl transferase [Chitinophagaceae bacterium]
MKSQWNDKIFSVDEAGFEALALELFRYQHAQNPVYRAFADLLGVQPGQVQRLEEIPFLPIRFFKSHEVRTGHFEPVLQFESSGTTGMISSRHLVRDPALYRESFLRCFERFYGDVRDYCIIGLLPSYLERGQSSLVYMVNELVARSGHPDSGFYLHEFDELHQLLNRLEAEGQRVWLIGVTFALLDFAATHALPLRQSIVLETGGMKGRRQEMVRAEVQAVLKNAFGLKEIHSEYGMTELFSQAYAKADGLFSTPPWMKLLLREEEDPLQLLPWRGAADRPRSGAVNIIDLANADSCCFIATDDAARLHPNGQFEILGRLDNSDVRGCSLLTA